MPTPIAHMLGNSIFGRLAFFVSDWQNRLLTLVQAVAHIPKMKMDIPPSSMPKPA
jgi:hypothetical protein